MSPVSKVPRQCPFVLLVNGMHMIEIMFISRLMGCVIVKFDRTSGGLH
jgi:hypothetical protein